MFRTTSIGLLSTLFFALTVHAAPPVRKAVVADTPEKFQMLVAEIQKDMAPGRRYEFLDESNRQVVNESLERMAGMLTEAGSVDAMSDEQKTKLFNIQESVNGILAKNADDRLVCSHSSPTGSHIPSTTCHTVRQLAQSRAASRNQFKDLANKQNAYDRTISTNEN